MEIRLQLHSHVVKAFGELKSRACLVGAMEARLVEGPAGQIIFDVMTPAGHTEGFSFCLAARMPGILDRGPEWFNEVRFPRHIVAPVLGAPVDYEPVERLMEIELARLSGAVCGVKPGGGAPRSYLGCASCGRKIETHENPMMRTQIAKGGLAGYGVQHEWICSTCSRGLPVAVEDSPPMSTLVPEECQCQKRYGHREHSLDCPKA